MSHSIPLGTVLRMHAAYQTPLSMREVGRQFGVGKSAVARLFRDWNLPVRPLGGIVGQVRAKPVRRPPEPFVYRAPAPDKRFCDQCELRVSPADVERCRSRFCKVAHLATGLAISGHAADRFRSEGAR